MHVSASAVAAGWPLLSGVGPWNLDLNVFAADRDEALEKKGRGKRPPTDLVAQIGFGLDNAIGGQAIDEIGVGQATPLQFRL